MNGIKILNSALAFFLELYAVGVLGYWGFMLQINQFLRITVGILAPILLMIIWGIWCAPSSAHRLEGFWLVLLKGCIFGLITLCLLNLQHPIIATVFVFLIIINLGASFYFGTL